MDIGKMYHTIYFYDYTSAPDGFGGTIDTERLRLTTFAAVQNIRSRRGLSEEQLSMNKTVKFTIRYRKNFIPTESMVIKSGGEVYTIIGDAEIDPERRFISVDATKYQ